jgi:hypothetical protein
MQELVSRVRTAAAVAIAVAALAGCGASASRPDPTPVSTNPTKFVAGPPRLPAHHPAGAVYVLDLTDLAAVQPTTVQFQEHDWLQHMQWTRWGAAVADGHGTVSIRVCNPSCVSGYTVTYPATVTLSHRVSCFGADFYVASSIIAETRRGPSPVPSLIRNPC